MERYFDEIERPDGDDIEDRKKLVRQFFDLVHPNLISKSLTYRLLLYFYPDFSGGAHRAFVRRHVDESDEIEAPWGGIQSKECPRCKETASGAENIVDKFGARKVSKSSVIPQSYCSDCRNEHQKEG